ncbi:hypothetical protein ECHHL_0820 [Ehrlichia chaffeensis str. Heartland]|uniref:Uncharacterized protein n=1 Tax=Ehrlichia chaffeensis (strain ATCC CRL-10679 / Arkansas) TaxID=205920 RepID=Q2GFR5_EHRCR|nr:hypothetical protein ECH_0928 [Ehrlichia chaffeensis str. Arkansas]AHX03956.1 hypothetical protein ECHHL_0820 [Ehrlichia chaffeensis str. Heartland]AHX05313.1 hypothetical protein ECHJAX_0227 [Ehrlichia chaffeensis str. Jax]AHX06299.1 hypothetical protein ECHLIB_0222 [Ehrlichia chaffeensis str. Liberty]AHX07395.1 hypothetical protein ECHOSC_0833 [Ehrlichia chaffeensis str. Osceola]AHX08662.1 hypothetical protein ECHSTV_0221 [Ehrlichia chaffeensis str. Saint Vincent]AHX10005.1 hypothetical 
MGSFVTVSFIVCSCTSVPDESLKKHQVKYSGYLRNES